MRLRWGAWFMCLPRCAKPATLKGNKIAGVMNKCMITMWMLLVHVLFCMAAQGVQPVEILPGIENCYRVSKDVYRSGQPDETGFRLLQTIGVKSVLNLREYHRDVRKAAGTKLQLLHYPVAAGEVTTEDLEKILLMLRRAPKPVLVHCWHGSDRTGIVIAAYRIVEQNVSVEEAEAEFADEKFGHHEFWYGNLRRLLRETDWAAFKQRINTASPTQVNG